MTSLFLKNAIDLEGNTIVTQDKISLTIAKALTYKLLITNGYSNNISDDISSYLPDKFSEVLKDKSVNYSYILTGQLVSNKNKYSISAYTDSEINKIYTVFYKKLLLVKFSTQYFDIRMYNLSAKNLSISDALTFEKIHYNVFCRIINYYKNIYKTVVDSDMKIIDVTYNRDAIVGKEVLFKIDNIASSRILSDIINRKISISYDDISLIDGYVWIRNK